jgi:hypothetical protein
MFLKWKTLLHSYMKLRCKKNYNALSWIWVEFRLNLSQFKFISRQMGCKLVEKVFKFFLWMWHWQKNFKKIQIWKNTFPCLFTWEWVKQIFSLELPNDDLWNLKLSYLNQFWWVIVIKIIDDLLHIILQNQDESIY